MVRVCARNESLLHDIVEGTVRRKATERERGRKRMHLLNDLTKGNYVALKRIAEDRKEWQKLKELEIMHLVLSRLLEEEEKQLNQ